jgi:hypothetical protein
VTPPSASGSYSPREYVELQVDYWTMVNKTESSDKVDKSSKKDSNKSSLKSVFKSLQVVRLSPQHLLPSLADNQTVPFALTVVTREKKQKSMILFVVVVKDKHMNEQQVFSTRVIPG